ncbi:hypothetical protein SteCoe_27550 [Stentor coeruleus]|uniref:Uncharacterized protein n=1 Tax=Stentor coeruleus TaxID=5963 RepID=A0A1R2BAC4_9CILI|nr:hypothetical protein SteCoe_27550 [Stentor coeruleus]
MVDYTNSYINLKQNNLCSISESSTSSRQLCSPRTIEDILRQKYTQNPYISKENSLTMNISNPSAHLEHVLANSRFAKRSTESVTSANSATPRFMPKQAQVSIKDLEKRLKDSNPGKSFTQKIIPKEHANIERPGVTRASLDLIQKLRQEVRNRSNFLEPEEPPDLLEMNVLERNAYWLQAKKQKIEEQRKANKDKELDGCTFKPVISANRMRTPISRRSKSPNTSYSVQYERKRNYRSNSVGKLSSRSTPKLMNREDMYVSPYIPAQMSPSNQFYGQKAGFLNNFLARAQPGMDCRYLK